MDASADAPLDADTGDRGIGSACDSPDACSEGLVCVAGNCNCVLEIESNDHHSCVVSVAGSVHCWGSNANGQIGSSDLPTNVFAPTLVEGLPGPANALALGVTFSCALASSELWCWGELGAEVADAQPQRVLGVTEIVEVAAGGLHVCVRTAANEVACVGQNMEGQLGRGSITESESALVPITPPLEAMGIGAGGFFSCAFGAAGQAHCWGRNSSGELGQGSTGPARSSPTGTVIGLVGTSTLTGGDFFACAVANDALDCWGSNTDGALGRGVVSGAEPTPGAVANIPSVAKIAAGDSHVCATSTVGDVMCWGANAAGQLGRGLVTTDPQPFPAIIATIGEVADVSAGREHTCALARDGSIHCWGANGLGQLGTGEPQGSASPLRSVYPDCESQAFGP